MSALFARAVAQASSGAARPAARPSVVRAAAGRRQRAPTRRSRRSSSAALGGRARVRASCSDATIAQSGEQARALWALRENIAEAQRRDGPNIKHDISLPVSAIPRFLDEAGAALAAALPGVALRDLRPPGRRQPALQPRGAGGRRARGVPRAARRAPTGSSTTSSPRTAAASAPSTASASRSATSSSATRARRARPDARGQGRARPARRFSIPARFFDGIGAMGKILFWIVVIFVVLFGLRLLNVAKAKRRAGTARPRGRRAAGRNDGPLRALRRLPAASGRDARSPAGSPAAIPAARSAVDATPSRLR